MNVGFPRKLRVPKRLVYHADPVANVLLVLDQLHVKGRHVHDELGVQQGEKTLMVLGQLLAFDLIAQLDKL